LKFKYKLIDVEVACPLITGLYEMSALKNEIHVKLKHKLLRVELRRSVSNHVYPKFATKDSLHNVIT
jgi:hypothetical protein